MKRERRSGSGKDKGQKSKSKKASSFLSVGEIVADSITQLSLEHWPSKGDGKPFSSELVKELYETVLCGDNVGRIQLLETSKYLEG